jgi:hypothetical protein
MLIYRCKKVFYYILMNKLLPALLLVVIFSTALPACNLGMHEWETAMIVDFPLTGPLLPASEINIINDRLVPADVNTLLWTTESFDTLFHAMLFRHLLPERWPTKLPWLFANSSSLANARIDAKTLLVSPDAYRLRVILFRDRLSAYRCQQLVIMQEGQMRLAIPAGTPPLAEQYTARTWLSVFFFDIPAPQALISATFSPVGGHPYEAYLNLELVESLLNEGLIQRRPDNYVSVNPESFPMPAE